MSLKAPTKEVNWKETLYTIGMVMEELSDALKAAANQNDMDTFFHINDAYHTLKQLREDFDEGKG